MKLHPDEQELRELVAALAAWAALPALPVAARRLLMHADACSDCREDLIQALDALDGESAVSPPPASGGPRTTPT